MDIAAWLGTILLGTVALVLLAMIADGLIAQAKSRHPVMCAWCLAEGRRTVVDRSIVRGSHGICPEHLKAL